MLKSEYVPRAELETVLRLLMPGNRAAVQLCADTGLRIGDALAIKRADLAPRMAVLEHKTGKVKHIRIGKKLLAQLEALPVAGDWLFPGRDPRKHRTRQAVWADLRRAAKACRVPEHLSPHSARKIYASEMYQRTGDLEKVRKALNHTDDAVTMIYALAAALQQNVDRYSKGATKRLQR